VSPRHRICRVEAVVEPVRKQLRNSMLPRPSIKQTKESEIGDLLECARRFDTSLLSTRLYPLIL
jgi:hypothetical protein